MNKKNKLILASFLSAFTYRLFAYLWVVFIATFFVSVIPTSSKAALFVIDSLVRFAACLITVYVLAKYTGKLKKGYRLISILFFMISLILLQLILSTLSFLLGWSNQFNLASVIMEVELIATGLVYLWFWLVKKDKFN